MADDEQLTDEAQTMTFDDQFRIRQALAQSFRPAAPIDTKSLFAGRRRQVSEILGVVSQPGQHGVIYGERGVGKTSLVTVTSEGLSDVAVTTRVNCDTGDDYSTVWRKVMEAIKIRVQTPGFGFGQDTKEALASADRYLGSGAASPDDVRRVLQILTGSAPNVVVFIDEFDRLRTNGHGALFADTIKTLSDQLVKATIVLVGVADNVNDLIAEHHSIERALVQIHMPRMSTAELAEIVNLGMETAEMRIDSEAVDRVTDLSQGLPHYTHLLAQLAGQAAADEGRTHVTIDDVDTAVARAISKAQQSIMDAYHRATMSTRTTLYPQVLLACALAPGDEFGFFAAADVRAPLSTIMGKPYDIPAFAQHLNELSDSARGRILQKKGTIRRFRYRFKNPLLQPYIIMRGLSSGLIDATALKRP